MTFLPQTLKCWDYRYEHYFLEYMLKINMGESVPENPLMDRGETFSEPASLCLLVSSAEARNNIHESQPKSTFSLETQKASDRCTQPAPERKSKLGQWGGKRTIPATTKMQAENHPA
jgi:hypothetical protein